jgi:hypothetical protein
VAGVFHVAAALVFPKEFEAGSTLDDHFWEHRRIDLLYQEYNVRRAGMSLVETGGWGMLQPQEEPGGPMAP